MGTIYDLLEAYLAKGKTDELKQYIKIAAENEIKRGGKPFSHWIDVIKTCDMSESWSALGYDDILSHVLHIVNVQKVADTSKIHVYFMTVSQRCVKSIETQ